MKNKKGFTLVELLAVIAILAILVIMALPAVLRMFNQARKDSFTNEVNTIIRTARQQYLLSGGEAQSWSNAEGSTNKLDLTGSSGLTYYVEMNGQGQVTKLQVSNGSYQYNHNGIIDIVNSSAVEEVTSSNELTINAYGISGTLVEKYYIDDGIAYDTYQEAVAAYGNPFFAKSKLIETQAWVECDSIDSDLICFYENHFDTEESCLAFIADHQKGTPSCQYRNVNITIQNNVGFIKDGTVYYLVDGDNSFETNKSMLMSIFDSSDYNDWGYSFHVTTPQYEITINQDNVAEVYTEGEVCEMAYGRFGCRMQEYQMEQ